MKPGDLAVVKQVVSDHTGALVGPSLWADILDNGNIVREQDLMGAVKPDRTVLVLGVVTFKNTGGTFFFVLADNQIGWVWHADLVPA